jgi:phosphatidate cytidylyltransferase
LRLEDDPLQSAPPDAGQPDAGQPDGGQPDGGQRRTISTGRNLPAALAVGVLLGGLAILTLLTIKGTFLIYVGVILVVALWELRGALASRDIHLPLIPIAGGGAAMVTLAYFSTPKWVLAAAGVTVIAVFAWRLPGGAAGYVRDVTAGLFTLAYLPLMAVFVALMLAVPDGERRVLIFLILTVCSDTGGYLAGIMFGRHPMVPAISPKKTWEGLGGSLLVTLCAGVITIETLLGGYVWQGVLLGAAAVAASTLGDLVESMIKRDLAIKDMGHLLPGHGGVMERLDSLLIMAPVIWLLLTLFVANGHAT